VPQVQIELALRLSSYVLIVVFGATLIGLSLVSMWKETRYGEPLKGVVWVAVAIIGFCAAIAFLAEYVQKARSLEKVSHRMEAVKFGVE
jgi:hypothetical protein